SSQPSGAAAVRYLTRDRITNETKRGEAKAISHSLLSRDIDCRDAIARPPKTSEHVTLSSRVRPARLEFRRRTLHKDARDALGWTSAKRRSVRGSADTVPHDERRRITTNNNVTCGASR